MIYYTRGFSSNSTKKINFKRVQKEKRPCIIKNQIKFYKLVLFIKNQVYLLSYKKVYYDISHTIGIKKNIVLIIKKF